MPSRRPLLWALLASGVFHAIWLVDVDWRQLLTPSSETDQVLARQKPVAIKRVRLAAAAASPRSGAMQVTLLGNLDAPVVHAPPATPHHPKPKPHKPAAPAPVLAQTQTPAPATPPAASAPNATTDTDNATPAPAPAPAQPADPTQTFPINIVAEQRAHYYGMSLDLRQRWFMEGDNYAIRDDARKFGFTVELTSEGQVSPDGLQPSRFRLLINHAVKNSADFDRDANILHYGRETNPKTMPLTSDFQDMASLPFHVAVTWEGTQDRKLMVTTGNSVYEIMLHPVAEELIRLPGGDLKTLHLSGKRINTDGSEQDGYDIWLAPDLRNFPVRFRGPDSKGNIIDMSVLSLTFEGKPVFGKAARDLPPPPAEPASFPEGLREAQELPDTPDTTTSAPTAPGAASTPDTPPAPVAVPEPATATVPLAPSPDTPDAASPAGPPAQP